MLPAIDYKSRMLLGQGISAPGFRYLSFAVFWPISSSWARFFTESCIACGSLAVTSAPQGCRRTGHPQVAHTPTLLSMGPIVEMHPIDKRGTLSAGGIPVQNDVAYGPPFGATLTYYRLYPIKWGRSVLILPELFSIRVLEAIPFHTYHTYKHKLMHFTVVANSHTEYQLHVDNYFSKLELALAIPCLECVKSLES